MERIMHFIKKNIFLIIVLIAFFSTIFMIAFPTFSEKRTSTIWDGSIATSFNKGSGLINDPYVISDGSELAYFFTVINGEESSDYFNKYFELSNNIDLDNISLPALNPLKVFSGSFDGNGYSLFNLKIDNSGYNNSSLKNEYALFSSLDNATIKNLNINESNINVNNSDSYASVIAISSKDSTLSNLNLNSVNIFSNNHEGVISSALITNDLGNNTISNIHIDMSSDNNNVSKLIYNYDNSSISNIITNDNSINIINDESYLNDTIYYYNIFNDKLTFNNNYPVKSVLELISNSSSYEWVYEEDSFRIKNTGIEENISSLFMLPTSFTTHASGIEGDTVYINDLESDEYYYKGLNYTYSDGTLPTKDNKNLYNENNLVNVMATYHGRNYENTLTGYVSIDERYNKLIYYKVYAVSRNGTASITDDYIEFNLIDNPFSYRPNDRVFNGFITDKLNAEISLDMNTYTRKVKIPVTYVDDKPEDIIIDFYSVWSIGEIVTYSSTGSWSSAVSSLKDYGMVPVNAEVDVYDLSNYYISETISRGNPYPSGAVNANNQSLTGNCRPSGWQSTCTYYIKSPTNDYDENTTYYRLRNNRFQAATPTPIGTEFVINVPVGDTISGYFRLVNVPRTASLIGFYDESGKLITSGSCTTSGGCSYYELIPLFDSNGNIEVALENKDYYYLATRDTNIIVLDSTVNGVFSNITKPFTLTSINNGTSYINSVYWQVGTSTVTLQSDVRIENIRIYSSTQRTSDEITPGSTSWFGEGGGSTIYGNWNNLKLGRGIVAYSNTTTNFSGVVGGGTSGTGSRTNVTRYTLIVESGFYNSFGLSSGSSSGTMYINAYGTYGNDIDRVNNNNSLLDVRHCASGSWSSNVYSESDTAVALDLTVKSGTFGSNRYDYATGIYVGGRGGGTHYAPRKITVEGGSIYNLIGGPLTANSRSNYNDTYMYIKGGNIDLIYGGAGRTETYGNRIIQMTGGLVNYSVFGGSNGIEGSGSEGTIRGNSYVYVGGNGIVGDENLVNNNTIESESNVEAGSIFGIGNGNTASDSIGSVDNSTIIIDESALIRRNVYGGGNYGATGVSSNDNTTTTDIYMLNGTVDGSIYGGGNNNGSGSSSINSTINIIMKDGVVNGSIYGGSRNKGTVYGSTNISVLNGTINTDIYGGGEGGYSSADSPGTFVSDNVLINIGDASAGPVINGNVYGGSAYGTVNAISTTESSNTNSTTVTVNNGNMLGGVFGGAKGNATYTPYIKGNITVNINNGIVSYVYGGFDQAGKPEADDVVYLNGGTVGSAFGGGNNTSIDTTKIYLRGSTVDYVYGGSNQSGDVLTTNVYVESGIAENIFGGNNIGGTCSKTNVLVTGGEVKTAIYGGGNEVHTITTNVEVINTTNLGGIKKIPSIYGGGNQAGSDTTNVKTTVRNPSDIISISNVYGGSNQSGTVNESFVTINTGSIDNAYGGNNEGGTTVITNVDINAGNIDKVFGGGNQTSTATSNVNLSGGNINQAFGGSNNSGVVTTTNVYANNTNTLEVSDVYGGNNAGGESLTTNVLVDSGTITNVYGGGNEAQNGNTFVTINSGNITNLYGGGNKAISNDTTVLIKNGNISNVYGGGNQANCNSTSLTINSGNLSNVYGGGNAAGIDTNTNLYINGGTINTNVYGGGNEGIVTGNTNFNIKNAIVLGSIYAGGNGSTAIVYGNTFVTVSGNTIVGTLGGLIPSTGSVFGGGNAAATGLSSTNNSKATVNIAGGTIYGNVYGGANTSVVYGGTEVNIGDNVETNENVIKNDILINGTVFGGGEANASGSPIYDFSFISVTKEINVNIDANQYDVFNINGSIFGSGNASSASGTSEITIKNYGLYENPKRNISIQRTNLLVIDNSSILLKGTTDRTNEYSDKLFTLSRIDELNLKNSSTLYVERGANLLKKFKSLNSDGTKSSVTITDELITGVTTQNRLYMLEVDNADDVFDFNIATNESITSYGEVEGMTFFGMYRYNSDDTINSMIYDTDYSNGDTLNWGDIPKRGSLVLGAHKINHDINVDGFYSNFINEESSLNEIKVIDPIPEDSDFYMWIIGELITEYSIDLYASKYSTLGAVELPFREFTKPNTTFVILGFDYSEIAPGVSLVNKNQIPRLAETSEIADTTMGLTIKTGNSGWLTNGETQFMTSATNQIEGTTTYVGENITSVPSLQFYLYHSKNLATEGDMGKVRIVMMAITKIDDLTNESKRLEVNVNLYRQLINTQNYESSITAGRQYSMFASSIVDITSKSSISTYFSLFEPDKNVYKDGYHRSLVSSYVLPLNTKLTLIDLSSTTPKYYYHSINESDVTNATNELNNIGEVSYDFSMFEVMGALNSGVYYNDAANNNIYYDSTNNLSNEEFIVIIDFIDTNIDTDCLNNSILIELRDANNQTIINVISDSYNSMFYDIYANKDAIIDVDASLDKGTIYVGEKVTVDVTTTYTQSKVGTDTIYDTTYFDSKMGLKLSLIDKDNNIVSGTSLLGLYYEINGVQYQPNIDGTTRIKIADKVGNTKIWLNINTQNSNIPTGNYKLRIESFGSNDGIYYGLNPSDTVDLPLYIINEIYGLDITTEYESMIIDSKTGLNLNDIDFITYNILYNSGLENPHINLKLYRRNYDTIYDTSYTLVDLKDYVSNTLFNTSNDKEYLVVENPNQNTTLNLSFKDNLLTGTYKLEFILYDNNTSIGTIEKYVIIK